MPKPEKQDYKEEPLDFEADEAKGKEEEQKKEKSLAEQKKDDLESLDNFDDEVFPKDEIPPAEENKEEEAPKKKEEKEEEEEEENVPEPKARYNPPAPEPAVNSKELEEMNNRFLKDFAADGRKTLVREFVSLMKTLAPAIAQELAPHFRDMTKQEMIRVRGIRKQFQKDCPDYEEYEPEMKRIYEELTPEEQEQFDINTSKGLKFIYRLAKAEQKGHNVPKPKTGYVPPAGNSVSVSTEGRKTLSSFGREIARKRGISEEEYIKMM